MEYTNPFGSNNGLEQQQVQAPQVDLVKQGEQVYQSPFGNNQVPVQQAMPIAQQGTPQTNNMQQQGMQPQMNMQATMPVNGQFNGQTFVNGYSIGTQPPQYAEPQRTNNLDYSMATQQNGAMSGGKMASILVIIGLVVLGGITVAVLSGLGLISLFH